MSRTSRIWVSLATFTCSNTRDRPPSDTKQVVNGETWPFALAQATAEGEDVDVGMYMRLCQQYKQKHDRSPVSREEV